MDLVKLGKKGQITIPKGVLKRAGIGEQAPLLVSASDDGTIVLRPAGVYPIEIYSDDRIAEFERENEVPPALGSKVDALVASRSRRKKR